MIFFSISVRSVRLQAEIGLRDSSNKSGNGMPLSKKMNNNSESKQQPQKFELYDTIAALMGRKH